MSSQVMYDKYQQDGDTCSSQAWFGKQVQKFDGVVKKFARLDGRAMKCFCGLKAKRLDDV